MKKGTEEQMSREQTRGGGILNNEQMNPAMAGNVECQRPKTNPPIRQCAMHNGTEEQMNKEQTREGEEY